MEQQWEQLAAASEDLAAAPDDEILAEILSVQAELLQQVRRPCAPAMRLCLAGHCAISSCRACLSELYKLYSSSAVFRAPTLNLSVISTF